MEGRASEVARGGVTGHPVRRLVLGMVAGAVATVATLWLVGTLNDALYPLPPEAGLTTVVAADRAVATMPLPARLLVLVAWGLAAFVGGAVAAWIVGRRWAVWPMAVLVVSGVSAAVAGFAHPTWMIAAGLLLPWPAAAAAMRFARHL